ncbi:MAG: CBS domain-containing protein [Clostridia bacterium]|nr:CBS domain-containing protein [Clostridia bacterium]
MNILSLLTHKSDVAYLFDDCSIRQALEKMHFHGYSAVPVIDHTGQYVTSVSEGDFLWYLIDINQKEGTVDAERLYLKDLFKKTSYKAVNINASVEKLFTYMLDQNFVPVVDDRNMFIGIITRKAFLSAMER